MAADAGAILHVSRWHHYQSLSKHGWSSLPLFTYVSFRVSLAVSQSSCKPDLKHANRECLLSFLKLFYGFSFVISIKSLFPSLRESKYTLIHLQLWAVLCSLHVLHLPAWVLSVCSGFFPQSIDIVVKLICPCMSALWCTGDLSSFSLSVSWDLLQLLSSQISIFHLFSLAAVLS